jgi:hypothetical protein
MFVLHVCYLYPLLLFQPTFHILYVTLCVVFTYLLILFVSSYCGSCWAFSAVEQLESDAIRAGILSHPEDFSTFLSPQQMISW